MDSGVTVGTGSTLGSSPGSGVGNAGNDGEADGVETDGAGVTDGPPGVTLGVAGDAVGETDGSPLGGVDTDALGSTDGVPLGCGVDAPGNVIPTRAGSWSEAAHGPLVWKSVTL